MVPDSAEYTLWHNTMYTTEYTRAPLWQWHAQSSYLSSCSWSVWSPSLRAIVLYPLCQEPWVKKYVPRKLLHVAFYCILMAGNVQFAFYVGCHVHCRLCVFYCILMVYILKFASENILHCLWIVYFVLWSVLIAFLHCNCTQLVTCWQNQAGTISATSGGFWNWLVAAVWWSPCICWSSSIWGCRTFYCTAIGKWWTLAMQ